MKFRPCIDIHNGAVKQIVGGSLQDIGNQAKENFVSEYDAAFYGKLYQKYHLKGGHIILLNQKDSAYFEATKAQAIEALQAYPKGLMIGGGIGGFCAAAAHDCSVTHRRAAAADAVHAYRRGKRTGKQKSCNKLATKVILL